MSNYSGFGEEKAYQCGICEGNYPDCALAIMDIEISIRSLLHGFDGHICKSCWGSMTLGLKLDRLLGVVR